MQRIIIIYGAITGFVAIMTIIIGLSDPLAAIIGEHQLLLGYLIMLVALSTIFVATKKIRDQQFGGIISFTRAATIGLGISAMAGIVYVLVWEIYLAMTDYAFIADYSESMISDRRAAGASAAEIQETVSDMQILQEQYQNPLFRLPMTFLEIFPIGLVVTLVSSAILRNNNVLPATR